MLCRYCQIYTYSIFYVFPSFYYLLCSYTIVQTLPNYIYRIFSNFPLIYCFFSLYSICYHLYSFDELKVVEALEYYIDSGELTEEEVEAYQAIINKIYA